MNFVKILITMGFTLWFVHLVIPNPITLITTGLTIGFLYGKYMSK